MAISQPGVVLQMPQHGVNLTVIPDENGAPTFQEPSPSHPGQKGDPGSHDVRITNKMPQRVRICLQSTSAASIEDQFQTPMNADPANDHIGWVEIAPPKGGATGRTALLMLADDAFPAGGGYNTIKLKVSPAGFPCAFGGPAPTQDIIIP